MWCCAHLRWHPASLLVPRAVGAGAWSPFVGRFHPSSTRSPFLSVSGAPGCVAEPAPAGAPQNTPLTPSRGENPAWEEQGERGDACHGWEVCHQPRAYRSPGESRNLRHSSRRSRGAPGKVSGCGWLLFSPSGTGEALLQLRARGAAGHRGSQPSGCGRAGAEQGGCCAASEERQTRGTRAVVVLKRCESQAANPESSAASIQTCQLLGSCGGSREVR